MNKKFNSIIMNKCINVKRENNIKINYYKMKKN